MVPRFRFAPSPTGTPHIGNLHTALFSWALVRAMDGDFILRIEDTDPARNTPESAQLMLDALNWLGIDWDEGPDIGGEYGPYTQSERSASHDLVIQQLLDTNQAYYGDDPNNSATAEGNPLRLRMPKSGKSKVQDAIRGEILIDNSQLHDPVLVRSNGRSLYHLAAMTDDHNMGITHVVRGEEWISTTPYHVQLYKAMGWDEPVWIHLPLILNQRGQKLKKRDPEGGYLITDFQQAGYLPNALFNYLLLLGWAPDNTQEMMDKWQVRKQFRLKRLSASNSTFDWQKLNWMNQQYLNKLSDKALGERIRPFLEEAYDHIPNASGWLEHLTHAIRSNIVKLEDAIDLAEWAFSDDFEMQPDGELALATEPTRPVLVRLVAEIAAIVILDEQTANSILKKMRTDFKANNGWKPPQIFHPIRAALTGAASGPPLPEIMGLVGKQRTLQRLANALR